MSAPLYCGGDGCTLHDFSTAPAFCEFQWQLSKKAELSETRIGGSGDKELATQISESIVGAMEEVFSRLFEYKEIRYTPKNAKTSGETPSKPYQNKRNGGISI